MCKTATRRPFFLRLPESDRRRLVATSMRRRFTRNEVIIRDGELGDTMYVIAKGRVAIRVNTPDGDVATLALRGRGDTFGEQALFSEQTRRNATVVALEPVETLVLQRAQFAKLRDDCTSVRDAVVQLLSDRLSEASSRLVETMYLSAEDVVCIRLSELFAIYTGQDADEPIKVTQKDLATMAGTTRPTVNRVLRNLEAKHVIELGFKTIDVRDPAALCRCGA